MKKILLFAIAATLSTGAFAQGGERGPFLTNRTFDNVFISAGGGINIYYGEADRLAKKKHGKRLAPALDIAIGKWFTPAVGARLEYSGLSAKGAALSVTAPYTYTPKKDFEGRYFPEKFRVAYVHADFLWNASASFGGYKEYRRWELVPFAGFGPAISSSAKGHINAKAKIHEFAFTAGLINKVRLTGALDFNLEFRGMLVKQIFDGTSGGKRGEGMGTISAGLSYKIGKRGFEKPQAVAPADYSSYNSRIATLESNLAAANAKADQLTRDLNNATGTVVTNTEYLFPDTAIFFTIGSAVLSEKEKINVGFIAEAIKRLPAGSRVVLDGNADSTTGTPSGNMTLSERRVKAVHDALVALGVRPDQLQGIAHGDTSEPFDRNKPALNRVLIIEH
jgi:outer membrane protein OmpA-like peptidoglycan-associated protein